MNEKNEAARRPVHEVRYGGVKAVIWRNPTSTGHMYNVTVARIYKDGEEWKEASSFATDDLLVLGRALSDAFGWIHAQRTSNNAAAA